MAEPATPTPPRRRRWTRHLWIALAPLGFTTVAATALDVHGQRPAPDGPFDAIIVAGCRVADDGGPTIPLARRTEGAVALWREGRAPRVVFTGGVGDHPPAEAVVAANYARSLGLPDEAIVIEDGSTSTEENARAAAALTGAHRVLVVTDYYHVFRVRRVFARYFAEAEAVGVDSGPGVRLRGALREVTVVAIYAILGRL